MAALKWAVAIIVACALVAFGLSVGLFVSTALAVATVLLALGGLVLLVAALIKRAFR